MSTATTPAFAPAQQAPPPAASAPTAPGGTTQNPAVSELQKPGYVTTEFWLTLFSLISTVGVGLFHWSNQQTDDWTRITNQLAPILAMVIGYFITRQYVVQRGDLKQMLTTALAGNQLKTWLATLAQGGTPSLPSTALPTAAPTRAGLSGRFTTVGGVVVVVQDGKIVQIGDTVAGG